MIWDNWLVSFGLGSSYPLLPNPQKQNELSQILDAPQPSHARLLSVRQSQARTVDFLGGAEASDEIGC